MTDSLSKIVTQKETFSRGNSKKMVLKDLMAEEGSNLKLMWVPAHVGIKGNETANKAAK
jgi:ribonuclease HI